MNKTTLPQQNKDTPDDSTLGQAYETSLEKALHQSKQADTSIHQLLDDVNNNTEDTSKTSSQPYSSEISKIKQSIKRDLTDAAHHLSETGKELKDWLGFDIALIKSELWLNFTEATDKTTLELLKLQQSVAHAEYHTGEIIGLGTLVCDKCKAYLHFHKPGHIPPCGKCYGTHFHRLNHQA